MRKVLCVLLAAALAAGLCVPAALAAETPTVSISSGTVAPGEEVTLTVSIQDNPGLSSTILHIFFDTSVFTANPNKDLHQVGEFSSGVVVGNTVSLARANGYTDCPPGKDGVLLGWFNATGLNVSGNGEMFTVTLHVSSDAKAGEYKVELGYSQENTGNEEGEDVPLTTLLGTVTVTGGGNQSADDKPDDPADTPSNDPAGDPSAKPSEAPSAKPSESPSAKPSESPSGKPDNTPSGGAPDDKPSAGEDKPRPSEPEEAELFSDVAGNWAEEYIKKAADRELIVGYDGKYRPKDSMTRAELVSILWRASGSPKAKPSTFTDLAQDWYKDAVAWAEETGAVYGVGGGRFDPLGHVSREQLASILHRMAGSPSGMEGMFTGIYDQQFADSGKLSNWAKASVYWAFYTEILCGNERLSVERELAPQADATRAQIAVMIVRYLDRMEKGG